MRKNPEYPNTVRLRARVCMCGYYVLQCNIYVGVCVCDTINICSAHCGMCVSAVSVCRWFGSAARVRQCAIAPLLRTAAEQCSFLTVASSCLSFVRHATTTLPELHYYPLLHKTTSPTPPCLRQYHLHPGDGTREQTAHLSNK